MSELKAGRELDALIAEKVMGWQKVIPKNTFQPWYWSDGGKRANGNLRSVKTSHWSPSANISDAWQVVEKLADLGYDVIVSRVLDWRDKYECCLTKDDWRDDDRIRQGADTAPMAICLATLKMVEEYPVPFAEPA